MAPPSFSDLGKACRDVFHKGYHLGMVKLDCRSTTCGGVDISSGGHHTFEEGKVFGNLETKYKVPKYGLTFTEKWNTDNHLHTEVACQDKIAPGLKLALDGTFVPDSGKKEGKFKAQYKITNATIDADVHGGDEANLSVNGSVVLGYQGWLGGYQMAYDTTEGKLHKNNFALGYCSGDFQLHAHVDNGETFGGSLYQRVSNRLETGVQLAWSSGGGGGQAANPEASESAAAVAAEAAESGEKEDDGGQGGNTKFGIGARYLLDPCTAVRAKVNNQSQVALAFEQKLKEGVTLTLCALVNGKEFNGGGHQVGLALELEP